MYENQRSSSEPAAPGGVAHRQLLLRAARLALVFVLPLYPLVPRFSLWGPLGIDDLIPSICLLLGLMALVTRRPVLDLRLLAPFLIFITIATLTTLLNAQTGMLGLWSFLRVGVRFGFYAVLYVLIVTLLEPAHRRRLLQVLAIVALFEALFGVAAYLFRIHGPFGMGMISYPEVPLEARVRVQGTFGGEIPEGATFLNRANFYSAFLVMGWIAFLASYGARRLTAALGTGIIGLGLMVSYSRMSLIAAFIGSGLLGFFRRRVVVVVAMAAVFGLGLLFSVGLRERFLDLGTDRFTLWRLAAQVIAAHPWTGCGDYNYASALAALGLDISGMHVFYPHASLLFASVHYGLPAGFMLLATYFVFAWSSFRAWRAQHDVRDLLRFVLVVTFFVHDLSNSLMFIPEVAMAFWIVFAATSSSAPKMVAMQGIEPRTQRL